MTTTRRFQCDDLFRMSATNMDAFTETYHLPFYMLYLCRFPALCVAQENGSGTLTSYILAKAEGRGIDWHGHISAVTVAPEYRRLGLAAALCREVERVSDATYNAYFVDLFVRASNTVAIGMYQKLGYSVYRRVLDYYGATAHERSEDAFDMRKGLPRDASGVTTIPRCRPIKPEEMWPSDKVAPMPVAAH